MKNLLTLSLLILMFGCGSIPEDLTPPPIDHNLYTVEMKACGNHRNVGQAGCIYDSKDNLDQMFLEVPLFHEGEYQITSKSCSFRQNRFYDEQKEVKLSVAQLIANKPSNQYSCTFDIKVFIDEFDRGLRGMFTLVDLDGIKPAKASFLRGSFTGIGYYQLRAGSSKELAIDIEADTPGTIVWFGCEIEDERRYAKNPQLKLKEIIQTNLSSDDSCILEVGLIPDDNTLPVEKFTFNLQVYNKDVVNLPTPSMKYKRGKLTIRTRENVAAMAINSEYEIFKGKGRRKLKEKVRKNEDAWVRVITSNGRYKLLKVRNGRVVWNTLKL